ncbi:MAG: hypothetical protein NC212_01475 [Staphylococcus sp.]|nr:hypothetical protein [Staphylococcus sp.]
MKRFAILSLLMFVSALTSLADGVRAGNFEFSHNRFSFGAMLTSSDSYQLEASYHYMFNPYLGVGGAFGYWQVYYEDGWASGKDWEIESDDNKPYNLYLRPSVVIKSPALRVGSVDLGLYAEPGAMVNVPYTSVWVRQYTQFPDYDMHRVSTGSGQWFALDVRLGVYANVGPCGFSAGYMMSNLDVYSGYRNLSYRGLSFGQFYPVKSFMQGAYLTLSYYF